MHSHPAEIHVKDGLGISRHPFGYGMNSHYLLGVGHTQLLRISPTFRLDGYHRLHCVCVCDKSLWSCPALCDSRDCSLPGSSAHGILQARITGVGCHALLQWDLIDLGVEPTSLMSLALVGGFFTTSATWEACLHCTDGETETPEVGFVVDMC